MAIDTEKIAYHIREILLALGDDPEREGLKAGGENVRRGIRGHELYQRADCPDV